MSSDQKKDTLDDLGARLESAKAAPIDPTRIQKNDKLGNGNALGLAFRVGVELISAVAVGTVIGWCVDYWLETQPWFMLAFIFLGGAAGIVNVYRIASGFAYAAGYQKDNTNTGSNIGTRKDEGK
jgi:ATP synthase protein I